MKYICKECGWVKENKPSYHTTTEDYEEIFAHEKKHKEESK